MLDKTPGALLEKFIETNNIVLAEELLKSGASPVKSHFISIIQKNNKVLLDIFLRYNKDVEMGNILICCMGLKKRGLLDIFLKHDLVIVDPLKVLYTGVSRNLWNVVKKYLSNRITHQDIGGLMVTCVANTPNHTSVNQKKISVKIMRNLARQATPTSIQTALALASNFKAREIVEELIKHVEYKDTLEQMIANNEGFECLKSVAECQDAKKMKKVLEKALNANERINKDREKRKM